MIRDANDPPFMGLVDSWISDAANAGARTLDDFVMRLPGVYPAVILARLQASGQVPVQPQRVIPTDKAEIEENGHWRQLPPPHPLDFTWWFDARSAAELVRLALNHSQPNGRVALLGTPTVFLSCIAERVDRDVVLLDRDAVVISSFRNHPQGYKTCCCDVRQDPIPALGARIVIADPPWYEEEMRHFLWACRRCCDLAANVLLSFPAVGTRPGIQSERSRMTAWAAELGLALVEYKPSVLTYASPAFEQNALRAAGVSPVHPNWRRGDLAMFVCVGATPASRPPVRTESTWFEEIVRGVRFRIRYDGRTEWADPTLVTLVKIDVLPSVSRREPIRDRIDVWTSGNRVFACHGPFVLKEILHAMSVSEDATIAVARVLNRALSGDESRLVLAAISQIQTVIRDEQHDMFQ